MPVSKAQLRATSKFNAKKYDSVLLRFHKGKLAIAQEFAKGLGLSFNAFVLQAIEEVMSVDIVMPSAKKESDDINRASAIDNPQCLHCGAVLSGRRNKKFCSDKCRVYSHKKQRKLQT